MADVGPTAGRRHRAYHLLLAGWLVYWTGLTVLLLSPKVPRAPISISANGLVVHFTMFALLALGGVLVHRALGSGWTYSRAVTWLIIIAAYGGITELLQPLTGRHCDLDDFLADTLGAGLVLLFAAWRFHKRGVPV